MLPGRRRAVSAAILITTGVLVATVALGGTLAILNDSVASDRAVFVADQWLVEAPTSGILPPPETLITATPVPLHSPTPTGTPPPADVLTPTPTATPSPTLTPTATLTATLTVTPSPTDTATLTPTVTATPSPAQTATLTPTMTATPSPTPIPTVTATPTPNLTPVPTPVCQQMIANDSFETQEAWQLGPGDKMPIYTQEAARSGTWSMRLAIGPELFPEALESWVQQVIGLPPDLTSAVMTCWLLDPPAGPGPGLFLILVQDEQGAWHTLQPAHGEEQPVLSPVTGSQDVSESWRAVTVSLDAFRGQKVLLRLGLYGDDGVEATVRYLDDVALEVCGP